MTHEVFLKASKCLSCGETAIQTTLHIDSVLISSHDKTPSTFSCPIRFTFFCWSNSPPSYKDNTITLRRKHGNALHCEKVHPWFNEENFLCMAMSKEESWYLNHVWSKVGKEPNKFTHIIIDCNSQHKISILCSTDLYNPIQNKRYK